MDGSQKTQQQANDVDQTPINSGQTQQDDSQSQQATQPVQTSQTQHEEKKEEIPAAPVSAPSKEGGPAAPVSTEKLVVPSLEKVEVAPELKEIGVEAKDEVPELTPEDAQAGIVHAKESTPVVVAEEPSIKLPMSQQQAQQIVKLHKKVKDSLFWFAMLILRQWQISERKRK